MTHERHIHQGRNIRKFREMLGLKQDDLADKLGDDWTQKKISQLESKEQIDDAILEQVSQALHIPKETLQNLDVQEAVVNIQQNYENSHNKGSNGVHYNFNPIDEWLKALEENKVLYERLLKSEQEKVAMLEKLLQAKK
ncbi:helix-turn-helix domain-containing protein [Taibaiella helva]|uniref:helix-turn-helix domain-containing protein n=1 Tax=Taibaiella helva TaxID=2301235 RepID=UPI000E58D899|nr:helix-turn-helix transcriptional regulator [Taibaiella helva]